MGIEGVPAPAACTLEVEAPFAVGLDSHLHRRMHDGVELGEGVGDLHVLVLVRHVDKGDLAVLAGQRHRLDTALQPPAAFFNDLIGELVIRFDAIGTDHLFDELADHVAAGDAGTLVEDPVLRCAHRTLGLMEPVAEGCIVGAGLAAGDHVAVPKALGLARGHGARRHRAGVDDVRDAANPADLLAVPEDRHDGGDVAGVDVADRAVVVGEHIPGIDAGVGFPVVLDHVLDRGSHGADVDDDAGRGQHAVTHGVVEREAEFAFLLDDGTGGDLLRGFAGMHEAAAQLGEQLFIADRVAVAELQLGEAVVVAGSLRALDDRVAALLEGLAALQQVTQTHFLVAHDVHGVSPYFACLRWNRRCLSIVVSKPSGTTKVVASDSMMAGPTM